MSSAIVTGAYGAIGSAICQGLVDKGYDLTLVGRDEARLMNLQQKLETRAAGGRVDYHVVDLSLKASIVSFACSRNKPLDLLINNAATGPRRRTESAEGVEMQWAVNVLSYFRMIHYFKDHMINRPDARIVNVASYWAGGLDLSDPEFRKRPYDNDVAYRQAKQADRMMTVAWAGRLKDSNITVNACHPGDVNSKLSNSFGFSGHETPAEGAATPLFLAIDERIKGLTGKYFEHLQEVRCSFSSDHKAVEALFNELARSL
ncbi:MAG: SDR family NAD(P)-dependent oxidoreductase [Bacteroidales bacterium]|nr:SDR family NAD(P)-dependent oxidoreductase [Bacteroidales bacterium]